MIMIDNDYGMTMYDKFLCTINLFSNQEEQIQHIHIFKFYRYRSQRKILGFIIVFIF